MVDKTDAHSEEEFQDKNFIEDPAQLDMYKAAGVISDGKFLKDLFWAANPICLINWLVNILECLI
jgi:hypothetical protein